MAQDRPTAAELLTAIADFLREEATPALDRAGAATALRASLDATGRTRIRVAAQWAEGDLAAVKHMVEDGSLSSPGGASTCARATAASSARHGNGPTAAAA